MAYGIEIHLAFVGAEKIVELLNNLGFEFEVDGFIQECEDNCNSFEFIEDMNQHARKAHNEAAKMSGWTLVKDDVRLPEYMTPYGHRKVAPFDFGIYFDTDTMGETPEDMTMGVALSGRYFPTFLDIENAHGTIYNFSLDKNKAQIDLAREEIVKELPFMKDAEVILREIYY